MCGFHVKKKGGRIPKQADGYQELIFKYLNIDIAHEDSYIHPTLLCDKCRQILETFKRKIKKFIKNSCEVHNHNTRNSKNHVVVPTSNTLTYGTYGIYVYICNK